MTIQENSDQKKGLFTLIHLWAICSVLTNFDSTSNHFWKDTFNPKISLYKVCCYPFDHQCKLRNIGEISHSTRSLKVIAPGGAVIECKIQRFQYGVSSTLYLNSEIWDHIKLSSSDSMPLLNEKAIKITLLHSQLHNFFKSKVVHTTSASAGQTLQTRKRKWNILAGKKNSIRILVQLITWCDSDQNKLVMSDKDEETIHGVYIQFVEAC